MGSPPTPEDDRYRQLQCSASAFAELLSGLTAYAVHLGAPPHRAEDFAQEAIAEELTTLTTKPINKTGADYLKEFEGYCKGFIGWRLKNDRARRKEVALEVAEAAVNDGVLAHDPVDKSTPLPMDQVHNAECISRLYAAAESLRETQSPYEAAVTAEVVSRLVAGWDFDDAINGRSIARVPSVNAFGRGETNTYHVIAKIKWCLAEAYGITQKLVLAAVKEIRPHLDPFQQAVCDVYVEHSLVSRFPSCEALADDPRIAPFDRAKDIGTAVAHITRRLRAELEQS